MSHLNSFSTGLGSQGRPSGDLGNNNIHQYLKLFMNSFVYLYCCVIFFSWRHEEMTVYLGWDADRQRRVPSESSMGKQWVY